MERDGPSEIYSVISSELGLSEAHLGNARITGCSVSWGNVWRGAVLGLAVGAVRGGIAGATAGTFTAPVIGTVTGGVGGAVAGGAAGFVEGAVLGVAAELLGSCFNGTKMQSVSVGCRDYFERLQNGQTDIQSMPIHCGEIIIDKDNILIIVP